MASSAPFVSCKQNFPESHIINPLLTKFAPSRWLDINIGLVLFCEFMSLDFVSVHKQAEKELGQYPAILTSHLVNNPYILSHCIEKDETENEAIIHSAHAYVLTLCCGRHYYHYVHVFCKCKLDLKEV